MIKAMQDFMKGVGTLHVGWRIWLFILTIPNMLVPLLFIGLPEARWTFAAAMFGVMVAVLLVKIQGFTRLMGLMHVQWFLLIPYLYSRLSAFPADSSVGVWIRSIIVLNTISLIIDAADVIRYILGNRKSAI